jgi:hypothetical protein
MQTLQPTKLVYSVYPQPLIKHQQQLIYGALLLLLLQYKYLNLVAVILTGSTAPSTELRVHNGKYL